MDPTHDNGELPRRTEMIAASLALPAEGPESAEAVVLASAAREIETLALDLVKRLAGLEPVDKRWLSIARTEIEQGFMALARSIERPAQAGR